VPVVTAFGRVERGEVVRSATFDAAVVASWESVVKAPSIPDAGRLVVDYLPPASAKIRSGQRVAEVSGRPVLLLHGRVPSYRDLRVGDAGADVVQLRAALKEVGCPTTDRKGYFGASTASCVARLYQRAGSSAKHGGAAAAPGSGSGSGSGSGTATGSTSGTTGANTTTQPGGSNADIVVPWGELLYEPFSSVTVSARSAGVGQIVQPDTPLLTITNGALGAQVTTDGGQEAEILRSGTTVTVTSALLGPVGTGVTEGTGDPTKSRIRFSAVTPDPVTWLAPGDSLSVVVVVARSKPGALTVPVGALTTTGAGEAAVQVAAGDPPTLTTVPVTVALVANGRAAVTPVTPGTLSEGQRVAVSP
jgi:hypothetical protein